MRNEESNRLAMGLLIGGVVGVGALYFLKANRQRKAPALQRIGRTMSEVGQALAQCDLESDSESFFPVGKSSGKGSELIAPFFDWAVHGFKLWKQIHKGG